MSSTMSSMSIDPLTNLPATAPSPPPEDVAKALAAQLVERLRTMDKGKAPPPLPLPAQSETQKTEAAANGWPETKTAARGPAALPSPKQLGEATTDLGQSTGDSGQDEGKGEKRVEPILGQRGLPMAIKRRMVELFATFHPLTVVVATIEAEFGRSVDRRHATTFDGDHLNCRLGKGLRAYFDAVRQDHVANVSKVAIAHQGQRLRLIGKLVEKAEKSKDYAAALKGLELAAKEMGGVMDASIARKVEHTGTVGHVHASVDDARAEVAMRLRQMVEAQPLLPSPEVQDAEYSAIPEEAPPTP